MSGDRVIGQQVAESLATALASAEQELRAEGHEGDLPDPLQVAKTVEDEMYKLRGSNPDPLH